MSETPRSFMDQISSKERLQLGGFIATVILLTLWYFWDERETALNLDRTELVELRKQLKEIELQKPKYQARSASAREADLRLANNETQLDKLLDQIARKHSINIEDFKGRTVKAGDRDEDKEGGIIVEKQTVTIRKTSLEKYLS